MKDKGIFAIVEGIIQIIFSKETTNKKIETSS